MSNDFIINPHPDRCPVCGSTFFEGHEVEFESLGDSVAIQSCTCDECGTSWRDVFTYSHTYITFNPKET